VIHSRHLTKELFSSVTLFCLANLRPALRHCVFSLSPCFCSHWIVPSDQLLEKQLKYWEIIAGKLSASGWSCGCVLAVDSQWRTIFVARRTHNPKAIYIKNRTDESNNSAALASFARLIIGSLWQVCHCRRPCSGTFYRGNLANGCLCVLRGLSRVPWVWIGPVTPSPPFASFIGCRSRILAFLSRRQTEWITRIFGGVCPSIADLCYLSETILANI